MLKIQHFATVQCTLRGSTMNWLKEFCYHIYSSQATIFYFSDIVHFSARSLTYSVTRGLAPLAPCALRARGLLGKRFPASPKSGNSRKRTRGRVPCSVARSGEGGSQTPPRPLLKLGGFQTPLTETRGLPDVPPPFLVVYMG